MPTIAICAVGRVAQGVSGGYIYSHDVYRAVRSRDGHEKCESESRIVLWQLDTWHDLFAHGHNESHRHGQQSSSGDGAGLMRPEELHNAYLSLPSGSCVVYDGFALLQAADVCFSEGIYRSDVRHVGFVQYPFAEEPDASLDDRVMMAGQEKRAVQSLDFLVGASECSLRMFRAVYPDVLCREGAVPTSVVPPIARFKGRVEETRSREFDFDSKPVEFLVVSNFVPRKNVMLLVKAMSECQGEGLRPWRLSILANNQPSEYRSLVRKFVEEHRLPVRFLNELRDPDEISAVFLQSHIFIHGSNVENYCMAASEAVCCGLVVCSTDVGEIRNFSAPIARRRANADKNAFFFAPGDVEALQKFLRQLLSEDDDSHLLAACSQAHQYACEIKDGLHDEIFQSFDAFSDRWQGIVETCMKAPMQQSNSVRTLGPDPEEIRYSHILYMTFSCAALFCAILWQDRPTASFLWLCFSIMSFVDMYIFRRSGLLRLSPYIIHHTARMWLYVQLFRHPESDDGWMAALNFNIYNIFLSASVLHFGLGAGDSSKVGIRPYWWRHIDLALYSSIIPQRIAMYLNSPHFQIAYGQSVTTGQIMALVEIGNAFNKLLFWKSSAKQKSRASATKQYTLPSQPRKLDSNYFLACLTVCCVSVLIALFASHPTDRHWRMRVPLEIGKVDGLMVATIVQRPLAITSPWQKKRRRKAVRKRKTLRLGIDTGSSLSWGCDTKCRVVVETRDDLLKRRTLVSWNSSTRHKTLLSFSNSESNPTSNTEDFQVKFADGTRVQGVFRDARLSLHGNEDSVAGHRTKMFASARRPKDAARLDVNIKIGFASRITERWKSDGATKTNLGALASGVPHFESGSVDGYFGLGISTHQRYPEGHSAWDQLGDALQRMNNLTRSQAQGEPWVYGVQINVAKNPPFAMTIMRSTAAGLSTWSAFANIQVSNRATHWSALVRNVRLGGKTVYDEALVHFDTGASGVFVPKEVLKICDRAKFSKSVQLSFRVPHATHPCGRPFSLLYCMQHFVFKTLDSFTNVDESYVDIPISGLRLNESLHASLVASKQTDSTSSRVNAVQDYASKNYPGIPQIVLGLPFFQQYRVTFQQQVLTGQSEDENGRYIVLHR